MISNDLVNFLQSQVMKRDANQEFPQTSMTRLSDEGLLKITLPGEPLSFREGNTGSLLSLLKNIGRGDLCVGRVYEGHINALQLVDLYASDLQKQRWHSDISDHQHLFGVWNTEADDGVHMHPLGGGRYRLSGCKTFCSGAGYVKRPLITCQREGGRKGWQMCIVPTEKVKPLQADSSFWKPPGMKATHSYKLDFTDVEIDETDLLGEPDDYYGKPHFISGAIRFAAVQLGAAEAIMETTVDYLRKLNRTGDPFQKSRIGEMTWLISSGNQWLETAGAKTDAWAQTKTSAEELMTYAQMTRTAIEEICLRCMQLSERSVGARGLMEPNFISMVAKDLNYYLRQPAPDASLTAIADFIFDEKNSAHELWR
jgi:alkylation response protein AidB-like acyl-CoA dehydrogenase